MNTINILNEILQPDMEISHIKIQVSKTKFTFKYKNMVKEKCEISNYIPSGKEIKYCKELINNIVYQMYMEIGNEQEALAWKNNERWELLSSEKLRRKAIQLLKNCSDFLHNNSSDGYKLMEDIDNLLEDVNKEV